MNILVTGGCGFIGSHFIEEILKRDDVVMVYNIDCGTYAANKKLPFQKDPRYHRLSLDIAAPYFPDQKKYIDSLNLDYVIHFAAESHVDNSIKGPKRFIETNIIGTFNLLEMLKGTNIQKFIHVSTDEVYGSLNHKEGSFTTESPYRANNPYSATKAASDLLVRSYNKTYNFPAIITNCSNNFGSRQYTEKMIPVCIQKLLNKEAIPLYGNGLNVRDWIYVKDHVNALICVLLDGKIGKQYLIGSDNELSNYELIHVIKDVYSTITGIEVDWEWFKYVEDRKGHDSRYSIDNRDFKMEFPQFNTTKFDIAILETVKSYL